MTSHISSIEPDDMAAPTSARYFFDMVAKVEFLFLIRSAARKSPINPHYAHGLGAEHHEPASLVVIHGRAPTNEGPSWRIRARRPYRGPQRKAPIEFRDAIRCFRTPIATASQDGCFARRASSCSQSALALGSPVLLAWARAARMASRACRTISPDLSARITLP